MNWITKPTPSQLAAILKMREEVKQRAEREGKPYLVEQFDHLMGVNLVKTA